MILLLFKKRTLVSVFMLSAKHGPYWYHSSRLWYDAALIGDWTQDIQYSRPGHPALEPRNPILEARTSRTRSQDIPHSNPGSPYSKPGHPILEDSILPFYTLYNIGYQITIKACSCKNVHGQFRPLAMVYNYIAFKNFITRTTILQDKWK